MIISWNWLKRYLDLDGLDPKEIADQFTITTAEIEDVILPPGSDFLSQFKVVQVEKIEAHPNADKLRCVKVNDGENELDLVCGAANVREGLLTILAPVGCKIGDFEIKASKIRGVKSFGMLCSLKEIGVGEDNEGIVELEGVTPGTSGDQVFKSTGAAWDLDNKAITHRPDLWGHYGIARELATVLKKELATLELATLPSGKGQNGYSVNIEDPEVCRRYCGLSVSGITIKPSPLWIQQHLQEIGQKPINNVVDATNFVMHELGHPTHAFDARTLPERDIHVSPAKKGEAFSALTGKDVELNEQSLLIRCGKKPVALAGIVGGENSQVSEDTTEIFLEAAHFAPLCIRKTAQLFDLRTDSAARFEKSLDPENAPLAIRRIVQLLKESCPDLQMDSDLIDAYPSPIPERVIEIQPEYVNRKLGLKIAEEEQCRILEELGFNVQAGEETWSIKVPSFRNTKDIEEPIDLVEEIGRIFGLEKIIPTSPHLELKPVLLSSHILYTRQVKALLVDNGYTEIKTYSFTNPQDLQECELSADNCLELQNPGSREQSHMRPSILPGHLHAWKENAKHKEEFQMFELGKVFIKTDKLLPDEKDQLLAAVYSKGQQGEGLYRLRNDLLNVLSELGLSEARVIQSKESLPLAHPARSGLVMLGDQKLGYIAELHPSLTKKLGLRNRLSFFVLNDPMTRIQEKEIKYQGLDKFPAVPFSVSLLVPLRTTVGEVQELLQLVDPSTIQDLTWEGNYAGESIPEGQCSMTFSMNFKKTDRTMQGDEIQKLQDNILARAAENGFVLRAN